MMKRNTLNFAMVAIFFVLFATTDNVQGQMGMGAGGMGGMGGGMGGMGGGMGGMGGGMGGMGGGMGGMPGKTPLQILLEEVAKKPETWSRPVGEEPAWFKNGKSSVDATEAIRAKLNETVALGTSSDFAASKKLLQEKTGVELEVNLRALDDEGINVDSLPAIPTGSGPLREQLRRMLEPLALTYRVCEGYVEITSKSDAQDKPTSRFYDLSYVVRDNSRLAEIVNAIQTTVDPDSWIENGGTCTCVPVGQTLIVRTSETNHLDLERLLARLSISPPPASDGEAASTR